MNWANESPYGQAVYDSLLQASPSGVVGPDLATAWSYNADKTVLTLTLRTGVKFTDGTAFDATTAAANLEAFQKGTSNNASDPVQHGSRPPRPARPSWSSRSSSRTPRSSCT